MTGEPSSQRSLPARVMSSLVRTLDRLDPARGWFLGLAILVFVVGAALAIATIDVVWSDLRLLPLAALVTLSIPTVGLAAAEYWASARMVGTHVTALDSARTAITSTAANLLPIPGGAVVRTQSLRREGAGGKVALGAQVTMALIWLSLAGLAGAVALAIDRSGAAWAFGGVSLAAGILAVLAGRYVAGSAWPGGLRRAAIVELGFVVNASVRVYLAIMALGLSPTPTQGVVLAASSVLSSFVAVFPAGLGIRELLAAGLAPLVGLDPATGFLAAALVRTMTMIGYVPLAAMTGAANQRAQSSD